MIALTKRIALAALAVVSSGTIAAADDQANQIREALRQQVEATKSAGVQVTAAATPIEFTIKVTSNVTIKSPGLSLSKVGCYTYADAYGASSETMGNTATVSSGAATCVTTMKIRMTPVTGSLLYISMSVGGQTATQYRSHSESLASGVSIPSNGATLAYTRTVTF